MIRYQSDALSVDLRIKKLKKRIDENPLKVAKVAMAQSIRELENQLPRRKLNIHSRVSATECSCWVSLELINLRRGDEDLIFRTKGHIDHERGELTKVFVRRWPKIGVGNDFYAAWCIDCGYLGEVSELSATSRRMKIDHVCPKTALIESVVKELKRSIIKPNTKPVVAGAASWNAAINKAILVIQEKAG